MAQDRTALTPWRIRPTRPTSRRHVDLARVNSALCAA
jgi:hypothetical protein